ncbi:hypothetical protein OC846_000478 [Tilletia horrida]|uniref:Magnesium transporter NIPA-domain-containing protein n=1 Tax=Tilletia horrida TaxID=155126 RepID=A0AAN6H0T6_9BASI|nr:hypothetical protein OC845_001120 [Tilletia horrida]KAK0557490.1 hypothetical protein OC846_000478 [Tilletia horrida]KAK0567893.1 hypothetical protein OC861_002453 [Tilletia horrida]
MSTITYGIVPATGTSQIPLPSISTSTLTGAAATSSASAAAASLSSLIKSASAALATETRFIHGESATEDPPIYKLVGIALAVGSGFLIGSSFVWKKKGLLSSQRKYGSTAGEGHHYLKSPLWWTGMTIMILGEVANFAAYMFAPAILVTPMGALSVVVCAVLSHFLLKESLTLFGSIGCFLCLVGSVIIAMNGPEQHASGDIKVFERMFLSIGFLIWLGGCIVASLVLAFVVAPKYGKKNMLVYIGICSLIGGLSVSTTSGLGSAILLTIRGENQFKHWFIYFLLAFVVCTLLIEINFLNKALELFNTAMVTPTYYVLFTTCTLISSIVLFQGLQASAVAIMTIVLGFLVICSGITLLQLSKVDPDDLANKPGMDRRTTLLLKASKSHVSLREKPEGIDIEEPGLDTVRGGMGVVGSLLRARSSRRISGLHASADSYANADEMGALPLNAPRHNPSRDALYPERYQLYDAPVSGLDPRSATMPARRGSHISFASNTTGGGSAGLALGGSNMGGASGGASHSPGAGGHEIPSIMLKERSNSQPYGGHEVEYYHTAPSGLAAMRKNRTDPQIQLAGIREASGESGPYSVSGSGKITHGTDPVSGFSNLTPASSNNSGLGQEVKVAEGRRGEYVDPYAGQGRSRDEAMAMPVLLRGNGAGSDRPGGPGSGPANLRSMWAQNNDSVATFASGDLKESEPNSPSKESAHSRRWGRRRGDGEGGNGGGGRETTGTNSSDSEEDRLLDQNKRRGVRSP